ncbi:Protein pop-1 [Dirofilaria immitis]|nr:Protein pop-1 [Dirofilaria immitis]
MLLLGSKPGAFVKPSPTFPTFSAATLSPTYGPLPLFYPFFLPLSLLQQLEINQESKLKIEELAINNPNIVQMSTRNPFEKMCEKMKCAMCCPVWNKLKGLLG